MREREQEILLFAANVRYTDALPSRMNFPHDFIKALSQVVLDQEKRIADLERDLASVVGQRDPHA